MDLAKSGDIAAAAAKVQALLGGLDVLVHSGGVGTRADALETTEVTLRHVLEVTEDRGLGSVGFMRSVAPLTLTLAP